MSRRARVAGVVMAAALWVSSLVAAPAWGSQRSAPSITAALLVYTAGSLVCHQRPERSFQHDGAQLPVCARCLGLYAGGLLGVMAWVGVGGLGRRASPRAARILSSPLPRLGLVLLAVPTAVSVATAALGLWDPDNAGRAVLALPLGAAVGALACAAAAGDLR